MSAIEKAIEEIRAAGGAEFAFMLTRRGRLVTRDAPAAMPEEGRMRLVAAAEPIVGTDGVAEVVMPRRDLVPYGGASNVVVYVAVASRKAVVCVVMAPQEVSDAVIPALGAGVRKLATLLEGRGPEALRSDPPPPPAPEVPRPASRPKLPKGLPQRSRQDSQPVITVSEAAVGPESLSAIEREIASERRTPRITVGESSLGPESRLAVEREIAGASPPSLRVEKSPPSTRAEKSPPSTRAEKSPPSARAEKSPPPARAEKSPPSVRDPRSTPKPAVPRPATRRRATLAWGEPVPRSPSSEPRSSKRRS